MFGTKLQLFKKYSRKLFSLNNFTIVLLLLLVPFINRLKNKPLVVDFVKYIIIM
jgi:hypothetical protein